MRRRWGSITKKADGVYVLRWPKPVGPDGRRRWGSETVRGTLADAEERLDELRELWGDGSATMTVDRFWRTMYWPDVQSVLAPSTLRGYRDMYEKHIRPAFGDDPLDGLRGRRIQEWLLSMPYGIARHARAVLSAMYSRAVAWDVAERNPMARRYRLPDRSTVRHRQSDGVLGADELAAVAREAEGEPWEAAFLLSAFGGARRSEAFGVMLGDMAFAEVDGILVAAAPIMRGVQLIDGVVEVTEPKTTGSARTVVVPEPWSVRLRELAEEGMASGRIWLTDDGTGMPPNPNTMAAAYKRWFLDKPYRYVPWKNLRNSYATNVHASGVELPTVAKLLGHTQEQTTFRHYDRPSVEQLGRVVIGAYHKMSHPVDTDRDD
jgi:integrase